MCVSTIDRILCSVYQYKVYGIYLSNILIYLLCYILYIDHRLYLVYLNDFFSWCSTLKVGFAVGYAFSTLPCSQLASSVRCSLIVQHRKSFILQMKFLDVLGLFYLPFSLLLFCRLANFCASICNQSCSIVLPLMVFSISLPSSISLSMLSLVRYFI